jgi:hypothetical protein
MFMNLIEFLNTISTAELNVNVDGKKGKSGFGGNHSNWYGTFKIEIFSQKKIQTILYRNPKEIPEKILNLTFVRLNLNISINNGFDDSTITILVSDN